MIQFRAMRNYFISVFFVFRKKMTHFAISEGKEKHYFRKNILARFEYFQQISVSSYVCVCVRENVCVSSYVCVCVCV